MVDAQYAIDAALTTTRRLITQFDGAHPTDSTTDNRYLVRPAGEGVPAGANWGWTTSFWPGMYWLGWELTGEDVFRQAGGRAVADFDDRVRTGVDLTTHDLGFLYTLSCVAPYRLLGDDTARQAALLAADALMVRFLEPAGVIQAWGDLSDPRQRGRGIIDSLMNLPLLWWASQTTGDARYADAARRHVTQLRDNIIRADGSTFHTFFWDPFTGEPLRGATEQGAHDDSCWARGQAWAIYGFALNHRHAPDLGLLDASRRAADYFLGHLPRDGVAYWDLIYSDGDDAPRDSSAAAIAACGLAELAEVETDPDRAERYRTQAGRILDSLIAGYTPTDPDDADAVLLHGVYTFRVGAGVDEGNLWGDYFYLEALARRRFAQTRSDWRPYW